MDGWKRYLKGYLQIELTGYGKDRFLNLCLNRGFTLWKIIKNEDAYTFYITLQEFRELKPLVKKTDTKIHILRKCGLPFFFYQHRKQKCFVIGFILCLSGVWYLSGFIWDIHVEGSAYYTEDEIVRYIETSCVRPGSRIRDIDRDVLEQDLMEHFNEIAWISCEIRGTQLLVTMTETIVKDALRTSDSPSDLVAAKDCDIVSLITRNGTPVAKINESVKRGDVLISAAVHIYDDNHEVLETDYVTADGDVTGRVSYAYEDAFDLVYYEKEYTGEKKHSLRFQLLNYEWNMWKPNVTFSCYDSREDSYMEKLGDTFYMPFSIKCTSYLEYRPVRKEYTEKQAKQKARQMLQRKVNDLQEKGVEILENNVKIEIKDGRCMAKGTLICVEQIGIPASVKLPAEEEKETTGWLHLNKQSISRQNMHRMYLDSLTFM